VTRGVKRGLTREDAPGPTLPDPHTLAERAWEAVAGEEDERACDELPGSACQEVRGNFTLNALNGASTKLAEQLASPGLVLPWMLGAVGAPSVLVGFLVPMRRAGALLPQLVVAGRIRSHPRRKGFWVAAGVTQAAALLLMIPAILLLPPLGAGLAVVGLLGLFSMASGVGSVAFKDVMAKTIPRGRRGRLLGVRATAGGLLALGAALYLRTRVAEDDSLAPYVALLGVAAGLWLLASALLAAIREPEGATEGGRSALEEARAGVQLLREAPDFRRFVLARAFLLSAQLASPFYALQAQAAVGVGADTLALMVGASSLAALLSSPFWGRFSDASSRRVMVAGGIWTGVTVALALSGELLPGEVAEAGAGWGAAWGLTWGGLLFALVFFSSGFAEAGVRLGRKTWLLDAAPERRRPLMVAVANTAVGVMYALAAGLGVLAEFAGVAVVLGTLGLMALAGMLLAWRLPEAGAMKEALEEGDALGGSQGDRDAREGAQGDAHGATKRATRRATREDEP
jgi:hypothetical protein